MTKGAIAIQQILRDALLNQGTFSSGKRMQDVAPGTGKGSLITRLFLPLQRAARFCRGESRIDGNSGLLLGEQDPVAVFPGKIAPGAIDIVAERDQDVPQVLAVPRQRPCSDGALPNGQGIVGHHRLLGRIVDSSQAMALGAGAVRSVRRKGLGFQVRLVRWIRSGTRIQHSQKVR
jgi:hypothetical protein